MATRTSLRDDALALLTHPAEYGRRLGFTKLRDDIHDQWICEVVSGTGDRTLQGHRGSFKTTCLEIALAEVIMTRRNLNTIFLRKTDDDVTEVLNTVRNILLHPLTQAIYRALTNTSLELIKSTSSQIVTSAYTRIGGQPQLLGIGLGGSLTGKHADLIITDDIVNRRDRESRAERERTKAIYQELHNLRNPGGRIVNNGTPWHKEDAFSLMPAPVKFDCYSTGILTPEEIEEKRGQMSPSLFAANYELRHIASDGALFQTARPGGEDPELLRDGIAHIDAAYGGEDYTALTCGKRIGDKLYLYGRLWHQHVDTVLDAALADAQRLLCGPVHCEYNGDKGYLAQEIRQRNYSAYGYTENQNKYIKISTYLKKWWPNIHFVKGTDQAYIDQITDFTDAAEHDDAPDSAACVARYFDRR